MEDFNAARLGLARRRRGLTQRLLAEQVGIARLVLVAYEQRRKRPGPDTLARLAEALHFPVAFFSGPSLDELSVEASSFRALTSLTAAERDRALGAGALAMHLSNWLDARFRVPAPSLPQLQDLDPETAAMTLRSEWGLGERRAPNMVHLLESRGVRVFSLSEDSRSMDAFSCWRGGVPYVFLNTMKTAEHSRMDAAHELGHLVLHWDGVARGREVEHQAQLFASAFLMPRGSVLAEAPRSGRLDQLIKIKKNWRVSVSALAVRMKALGLLSDWQYRGLFIEMGHMGYRTTEPNGIQPETSQVLAKMFKALREEKVTQEQIAGELSIYPDELAGLVFGLVLVPVEGGGTQGGGQTRERPQLRLIS